MPRQKKYRIDSTDLCNALRNQNVLRYFDTYYLRYRYTGGFQNLYKMRRRFAAYKMSRNHRQNYCPA